MVYRGLTPPWLFAHGEPEEVDRLLRDIPTGTYQFSLLANSPVGAWAADFARRVRLPCGAWCCAWRITLQGDPKGRRS